MTTRPTPGARPAAGDDGAALPAVLLLIVVLSGLTAALALVHLARSTRAARDLHEARALYAAEAGVARALARLSEDPAWRPADAPLPAPVPPPPGARPPGGPPPAPPRVSVRAFGGYVQVASTARVRGAEARLVVLVGGRPPDALHAAVVFGDPLSALTLAGETVVRGEVLTGPQGVTTGAFSGRPYTGRTEGPASPRAESPLPPFDDALFRETLDRAAGYLALLPEGGPAALAPGPPAVARLEAPFADSVHVYALPAGAVLGADAARVLTGPAVVLVPGDLRIEGPLDLPPGTQVIAGGRLDVVGAVAGHDLLLVADRLHVGGPVRLQGQALARRALSVDGGGTFASPSVLYVRNHPVGPAPGDDGLVLGDAVVDGVVVTPAGDGPPPEGGEPAGLVVGRDAVVRGAVYAGRRARVEGRVDGTVLARQFFFYASPAAYVNWLADAHVDRPARPGPLVVPAGLGAGAAYAVVGRSAAVHHDPPSRPPDRTAGRRGR